MQRTALPLNTPLTLYRHRLSWETIGGLIAAAILFGAACQALRVLIDIVAGTV